MIKKYDQFINEEEGYVKNIVLSLATVLGLGISKSDAQEIKNNQNALSIIDSCGKYNRNVMMTPDPISQLKLDLKGKVEDPNFFIKNHVQMMPDRTIIIKPHFINDLKHHKEHGIGLNINPKFNTYSVNYVVKF